MYGAITCTTDKDSIPLQKTRILITLKEVQENPPNRSDDSSKIGNQIWLL